MTQEQTIKDVLEALHDAMQKALPEMDVYINIQVGPKREGAAKVGSDNSSTETQGTEEPPETLDNLRTMLNAFAQSAGKDKALELVGKYANGSKNPADIPSADYSEVITAMGGYNLDLGGDT